MQHRLGPGTLLDVLRSYTAVWVRETTYRYTLLSSPAYILTTYHPKEP